MPDVVDLAEKFKQFDAHWSPHVVGEVNDCSVKLAKLKGEFPWHSHPAEDEMFFVVKGRLTMRFRDKEIVLLPGQFTIVPAQVEHQPFCEKETWVMLFEPSATTNTGELTDSKFTKTDLPRI